MKQTFLFFFLVAVALVSAKPQLSLQEDDKAAPVIAIVKSAFDIEPSGSYNFGFETENKIQRDETGELKTITNKEGKEVEVVVVRGSYSYEDPAGNLITVNYYADETGFHPEFAHLPNVPGVGPEVKNAPK